ncbi:MAG: UDP-N-acetylmuramoyl-tripeptide--D-alanyl-D-alanine ligase [Pseudomonadota bacterium]
MKWSLAAIASVLGLTTPETAVECSGVSIDSRTLGKDELFVALSGPNFDGADFIRDAADKGACAAVTTRATDNPLPQLVVDDTVTALHALATAWRNRFSPLTVGITGSNGKTTMRSLIAALCGPDTHATTGNLNNHLGVPLVLFGLNESHRFAVLEMGANHVGEIAALAALGQPDIGIVTNAGPAHLEGFGGIEGVARGKGEMFEALGQGQTAVINRDDHYFDYWLGRAAPADIVTFGANSTADVWYSDFVATADGCSFSINHDGKVQSIDLRLSGVHNAMNTAGACAVALAAGIAWEQFAERLKTVSPVDGRQVRHRLKNGTTLIDDTYNANPASMRAAADALVANSDQAWMVVGDMFELGDDAYKAHRDLGAYFGRIGIARVFALGEFAEAIRAGFGDTQTFTEVADLNVALAEQIEPDVAICIKGSRSARMERVVTHLLEAN